jgi:hypothetical protein
MSLLLALASVLLTGGAMTDWMNFGFLLLTFGLGIGFVWACERMK